jgi:hypothetical protein
VQQDPPVAGKIYRLGGGRIIDSHKSPSITSGSAPLIRGDPSRRMVPTRRTPGLISLSDHRRLPLVELAW